MLYFDPAVVTELVEAEGATGIEVVRPAVSDRVLATRFAALFGSIIDKAPDPLLLEESLLRLIMRISRYYGLRPPPGSERSAPVKKALVRLDGDAASPIGLNDLAELAGLSRFQPLRVSCGRWAQCRTPIWFSGASIWRAGCWPAVDPSSRPRWMRASPTKAI
jgi:hypothetical protein